MTWTSQVFQDLRFALRGWKRTPGFAIAAAATLALGVGANTAIFSVVSGVLLRPLPFPRPSELAELSVSSPSVPGLPPTFVTAGDLESWRREASLLEAAATYSPFSQNLLQASGPEQVATVRADRSFFPTLGVEALFGRTFRDGDPTNVVVASFGFWQRHFGGDRSAIGQILTLDGEPFTLLGVMPPEFRFPYRRTQTDLWTAWAPQTQIGSRLDAVIGRLKTGVSATAARSELSAISERLVAGRHANVLSLEEAVRGPVRKSLLVLLGAVGFVLLVACANVANLLLARFAGRSREVAVRIALGARRARLLRQFLTESLLVAAAGGAIGGLVGTWTVPLLVQLGGDQIPLGWSIGFDWRVFTFLVVACLVTGVSFGLAPAFAALRGHVQRDLKSGERGSAAPRVRDGLVVIEIALAFMLLTGAGLLLQTFVNLRGAPTGFDASGVLTLHVVVADAQGSRRLEERVAQVPGVGAVGFISLLPLQNSNWNGRFSVDGRPGEGSAQFRYVTPGYFRAMGIPLRRGRELSDRDATGAQKVLLVNESLAGQFFPNEDPVGHVLTDRGTIVGVVGDVRQSSLDHAAVPELYYPVAQNFAQLRSVGSVMVVKTALPPESLLPAIRAAIRDVSPTQATFRAATLERVIEESLGSQRFYLWLMGTFAVMGTALAVAGTYGVIAYLVTTRAREFGIRMALGADARRVVRLVVGRGAALAAIGLMLGAGGSLFLARFLVSQLYGVTPADPATLSAVAAILAAVAVAACVMPALRAARIDPAVALRAE